MYIETSLLQVSQAKRAYKKGVPARGRKVNVDP